VKGRADPGVPKVCDLKCVDSIGNQSIDVLLIQLEIDRNHHAMCRMNHGCKITQSSIVDKFRHPSFYRHIRADVQQHQMIIAIID
jgi:hypothetical protein